jgi:cardiolipin synthase (CMP-forming)
MIGISTRRRTWALALLAATSVRIGIRCAECDHSVSARAREIPGSGMPSRFFNLPMLLTWARIVMIPFVVAVYYFPDSWIGPSTKNLLACVLFSVAAVTDAFDGYYARKFGLTSRLGAFLDPVADKLMVCAALIVLLELGRVDALVALVIIGREITVSALREWMAQIGASQNVAVNWVGKFKTIVQMVAIPVLLYHDPLFGMRRRPLRHFHWLLHNDIERDHEAENDRKEVDRQRRDVGCGAVLEAC